MMAASGDELNWLWKRMASLRRPDRNQMLREKKTCPVDCVGSIRVHRIGSHEPWSFNRFPHFGTCSGPSSAPTRKDDATTSIHSVKVDHHLMMHEAIKVNDRLVNNVTGLLLVVLVTGNQKGSMRQLACQARKPRRTELGTTRNCEYSFLILALGQFKASATGSSTIPWDQTQ